MSSGLLENNDSYSIQVSVTYLNEILKKKSYQNNLCDWVTLSWTI